MCRRRCGNPTAVAATTPRASQKASGRPIGELITERIIEPLGLRGMYWPAEGETTIRGTRPRGYFPADPPVDITGSDPSHAWSAGALVGRPSDVNRFLAGLLGGRLLVPAQLAEMKKTVAAPGFDSVGGSRYGLGLATFALSCGGFAWAHGGIAPGYVTVVGITASGRAATAAVNSMVPNDDANRRLERSLDIALCRGLHPASPRAGPAAESRRPGPVLAGERAGPAVTGR